MVSSSTPFLDIQNHWARSFINVLQTRGIANGLPNGTYRPDNSMTRAEFAVMLSIAFSQQSVKRQYVSFADVPATHWAADAIKFAYTAGFISGFPDQLFRPEDRLNRIQVLMSLVGGLDIANKVQPDLVTSLPQIYQDAAAIPTYATNSVAIATKAGLVSSHPNINLLNPTLAATRADAAVFIYQGLVYLGQVQAIASNYIITPPKPATSPKPATPATPSAPRGNISVGHRREFRGVWVASVWNGDWPSAPGLSVEQQKTQLINLINRMQALNLNALIFQIRPEGDAVYASSLEPWSSWLTLKQGKAPLPFYDPLEFALTECHKRNIELHAWFNPYRANSSVKEITNVAPHLAVTHPESVYRWGNQLWMDPGAKVVQDRTYNVILDVVNRYDIDGVHLDDYFYPYPIDGKTFPDNRTYSAYQATGGQLSLDDWRRENVNRMVQRLSTGIKAAKPHVKFGISPFGIYRPGQPAQIKGLDAYNVLYADSKKWLEQGWIDYLAPQLYWKIDQTAQSYPVLLKWWTDHNPQNRHIYAGNNLGQLDGKSWKSDELDKQVKISRNLVDHSSLGNIFYSANDLSENRQGIYDQLKSSIYPRPVLPPAMPWLKTTPPAPPTLLDGKSRKLTWQATQPQNIRAWTVYQQSGSTWALVGILPAVTRSVAAAPGTYAVCAVDRLANESTTVVVTVS
ncbi:MAG: family 10 glycosylhydrolase [Nostocaceae cyanobacterium]|nr:family 10 glycosylhydrolase [Nostocaceae cyanobacterium]